jgi:hypothetical protein
MQSAREMSTSSEMIFEKIEERARRLLRLRIELQVARFSLSNGHDPSLSEVLLTMTELITGSARTLGQQISDPTTPEQRTLALAFYAAVRAETLQRITMREQVLLASLTVSGVITGLAFNGDIHRLVWLAFFTVPFALAHARHSYIMGKIAQYVKFELNPFLGLEEASTRSTLEELRTGQRPTQVRHWDSSLVIREAMPGFHLREVLVHTALMCGPAITALLYARHFLGFRQSLTEWIAVMVALLIIGSAYGFRAVLGRFRQILRAWIHRVDTA